MRNEEYCLVVPLIWELWADSLRREAYLRRKLRCQLENEGLIPLSAPELFFDEEYWVGQITVLVKGRRLVVVPWTP
jgi:hypothetical protein